MTSEGRVKAGIKDWLKARGFWPAGGKRPAQVRGWYYMPANNGMGVSGIPDFVGSFWGNVDLDTTWRPFAIEAKAPGGTPSPTQLLRHEEMRAAGWLVFVIDDVSQLAQLEAHLG